MQKQLASVLAAALLATSATAMAAPDADAAIAEAAGTGARQAAPRTDAALRAQETRTQEQGPVEVPKLVASETEFKTAALSGAEVDAAYRLAKYDVIRINIASFPEGLGFSSSAENDFLIGPDGRVSIPYAGNIPVAGLTLDEARRTLSDALSYYLRDPDLIVSIRSYGPRKVYVIGEVAKPGIQEMSIDTMNAYAALSSAGGWSKRGWSSKIQIMRVRDGVMYYRRLDMQAYMKKHDLTQNVALLDGDILYVPKSNAIVWNEDILPYVNVYALYRSLTQ